MLINIIVITVHFVIISCMMRRIFKQGQVIRKLSLLILSSVILFSCSPILRQDSVDRATMNYQSSEIRQNPAPYKGNLFMFGGIIVNTTPVGRGSLIEALYVPVDSRGYLKSVENTGDRYLAIYPKQYGFLDPMIFRRGREVTIAGEFIALETGKINEMDYTYPVFQIEEVHLWRDTSKKDFYTGDSYHTPMRSEEIGSGNSGMYLYDLSGHIRDDVKNPLNENGQVRTDVSSIRENTKSAQMRAAEPAITSETTDMNNIPENKIETTDQTEALMKPEGQGFDRKGSSETSAGMIIEKPAMRELPGNEEQTAAEERASELPKEENGIDRNKEVVQKKKPFSRGYYVQVGAWKHPDLAEKMFNKVKEEYHEAHIVIEHDLHKVRISGVKTRKEGIKISQDIEKKYNVRPIVMRNP